MQEEIITTLDYGKQTRDVLEKVWRPVFWIAVIHNVVLTLSVFNALFPVLDPFAPGTYWATRSLPVWAEFCVRWGELDYVAVVTWSLGVIAIWGAWLNIKRDPRGNAICVIYLICFWFVLVIEVLIALTYYGIESGLDPRVASWSNLISRGMSTTATGADYFYFTTRLYFAFTGLMVTAILLLRRFMRRWQSDGR